MQNKNELVIKWVEALRSDKYSRATGVLFNGHGYCCLGVADKVCFNAIFIEEVQDSTDFLDDEYNSSELGSDRAKKLGLNTPLTELEVSKLEIQYGLLRLRPESSDRQSALIALNDTANIPFPKIADVVVELGWDKVTLNSLQQ